MKTRVKSSSRGLWFQDHLLLKKCFPLMLKEAGAERSWQGGWIQDIWIQCDQNACCWSLGRFFAFRQVITENLWNFPWEGVVLVFFRAMQSRLFGKISFSRLKNIFVVSAPLFMRATQTASEWSRLWLNLCFELTHKQIKVRGSVGKQVALLFNHGGLP